MKLCLSCHHAFADKGWRCPSCGAMPDKIDGFFAFAPNLAATNDGMDRQAHHHLDSIQEHSFWFRARNRLIIDLSSLYFGRAQNVLEVGCGTGYVLRGLQSARPEFRLSGSEIYTNGLCYARKRLGADVPLFQMDARAIPFVDEFDLICAFDVLEHIEEDTQVLSNIAKALRPRGGMLLSVPQHPFLWSRTDEIACHKRRYRSGELVEKCRAAGFEILRTTSFVAILLPIMLAQRLARSRLHDHDVAAEFALPRLVDRTFELLLEFERRAIGAGLSFPFGGSRFVAARKPDKSTV